MAVRGTVDSGAGGTLVTSVTGTTAEVTASPTTGAVIVSLPTALTFTGKTVTGGTFSGPTLSGTVAGTPTFSGAITFSSTLTPSQTAGIVGTTTNNSANTGSVGEYVSSNIAAASPISLTSNTAINVTSISLTAGDWDVWFLPIFSGNAASVVTRLVSSISQTNNTLDVTTGGAYSDCPIASATPFSAATQTLPCGPNRISLASTTTIYGVVLVAFSINAAVAYGLLAARRIR